VDMPEYTKINTVWKRTERGQIIEGEYATPELAYLAGNEWEWTEKVNGTNIRVGWDGMAVEFGGRTANAQIPAKLVAVLRGLFEDRDRLTKVFGTDPAILYGEGYGAGIQNGGLYAPEQAFVLFDVLIDRWWLSRANVNGIAEALGLRAVPVIGRGTLPETCETVKAGLVSQWGSFPAEGIVARPVVDLFDRKGERIVAKIKAKDYR